MIEFFVDFTKLNLLNIGPNLYRLVLYLVLKENNLEIDKEIADPLNGFSEFIFNNSYEKYFLDVLRSNANIKKKNEDTDENSGFRK